jgi:hypothetical protein
MRIICRFTQLLMRLYADPSEASQSPLLDRHLKHCAACRAYCHRLMHVDDHLRAGPTEVLTSTQYDRIQTSVLKRLKDTDRSSEHSIALPARRGLPVKSMAAAAAAMLFLAVNVLVLRYHFPAQPAQEPVSLSSLFEDTERFGRRIPQLISYPDTSMKTEMSRLANDAQRAVLFVLNCTPRHPGPELDNGI